MALEIWDPKINMNSPEGALYSLFGTDINGRPVKPPEDEGWVQSGTRLVAGNTNPKTGTTPRREQAIYIRQKPEAASKTAAAADTTPAPEAKLNTEAIASARAKADEVRRGSLANAAPSDAPSIGAGGVYDSVYKMGQDKDYQFGKLIDQLKANAIETSAESATALRFGIDRLAPEVAAPKLMDPWEAYERFKSDIKA